MNPLGIIVALPAECRSLGVRLKAKGTAAAISATTRIVLSGAGPDNARYAAETLADQGAKALLSWGCCAALVRELPPGALILPEALLDQGQRLATDTGWRQRLHDTLATRLAVEGGALAQSRTIVATPAEKAALARSSGAVAVDMESAAIARVAAERRLACVAIRAVADPLGMALPQCVLENTDADGDTRVNGLLLSLARHPKELPALLSLGHHFAAAVNSLQVAAKLAGPDFLLSPLH